MADSAGPAPQYEVYAAESDEGPQTPPAQRRPRNSVYVNDSPDPLKNRINAARGTPGGNPFQFIDNMECFGTDAAAGANTHFGPYWTTVTVSLGSQFASEDGGHEFVAATGTEDPREHPLDGMDEDGDVRIFDGQTHEIEYGRWANRYAIKNNYNPSSGTPTLQLIDNHGGRLDLLFKLTFDNWRNVAENLNGITSETLPQGFSVQKIVSGRFFGRWTPFRLVLTRVTSAFRSAFTDCATQLPHKR